MTSTHTRPVAPPPVKSRFTVVPIRTTITIAALLAVALALVVISASVGQMHIPASEVLGSLLHHLHIDLGPLPSDPNGEETLWVVRFPRIVLGLLVGAALAAAGCLLQGVLANPLAEPSVIGVSSGAAVGASIVIVGFGVGASGWGQAGAAFGGGLVAAGLVYALSSRDGTSSPIMLVLTGIAVNAVGAGIIAYFMFIAGNTAREQIVFWQLGSLSAATWSQVWIVLPLTVIGVAASLTMVRKLDLLALGELSAASLGIKVETVRRQAIVLVAILTAAGVAFTGIVMFVGLVVPHVMRLLVGPRHAILLPASVIGGAIVITAADLASRTLVHAADLPLGMLTSLIGGPAFFILLRRSRAGWGW